MTPSHTASLPCCLLQCLAATQLLMVQLAAADADPLHPTCGLHSWTSMRVWRRSGF
jgi:hypothetical protein